MTTKSEADWEEFGNPAWEPIYGADCEEFKYEQVDDYMSIFIISNVMVMIIAGILIAVGNIAESDTSARINILASICIIIGLFMIIAEAYVHHPRKVKPNA